MHTLSLASVTWVIWHTEKRDSAMAEEKKKRDGFGSKLGIIAAAAGSAIGLGNIYRFPCELGENGGAAFLLVYLLVVIFLGIPATILYNMVSGIIRSLGDSKTPLYFLIVSSTFNIIGNCGSIARATI